MGHTQLTVTSIAESLVSILRVVFWAQCFIHDCLASSHHAPVEFAPPKSRPKHRHWSNGKHDDKLKKHKSNGPKDKKQKRPPPVLMYIVGEALTLHRKNPWCIIFHLRLAIYNSSSDWVLLHNSSILAVVKENHISWLNIYWPFKIYLVRKLNKKQSFPFSGDGRLLKGISDNQERKITCMKNTFESSARSEQKKETSPSSKTSTKTVSTRTTKAISGKPSSSTAASNSAICFNSDTVKDSRPFPQICT